MPSSVQIGFLVIGGILILIAIVGGNFKLFGAEVASTVSNKFLRFVAFALGIILLILAVGTPSPEKNPTSISPQPTTSAAQSPQTSSIDGSFVGNWSNEGDVKATERVELNITEIKDTQLSGTFTARKFDDSSASGLLSVTGEIQGEVATLEVFDQQANQIGKAELKVEGKVLVWRLIRGQGKGSDLPSLAYLYR